MKRSFLDSVLRGAEALAARDPVGTLADPDLLRRFATARDPSAFAMLVRRHGPLVWGVCRNLLPADADAEDAFQATFLALVRSAAGIRRTEALGGWLHGVAYRVALKARRAAARRKKHEAIAAVPEPNIPVPDAAWDELQAAVHQEVCRLPMRLRLPFVLCGLQGRPQREAAEVLGWKVGSVSSRLTEARRRLLDRLARRGVPVGLAAGAAVVGGVVGRAAVPSSMIAKVLSAAGSPAAVSQTVLFLARGVTPMYLTRTKLLAASLLLAGILTTSIGALSRADAQAPPADPAAERLRAYYDALRAHQAPRDRWEYRFIPVEKPLTTADLQKVLAGADQEGWGYCGSQELADNKSGKTTPHMVFKRARVSGVAAGDVEAATALLADVANRERAVERERAAKAVADDEALYIRELREANRIEADKEFADKATAEKLDRLKLDDRQVAENAKREAVLKAQINKAVRDATQALLEKEAARRKELDLMRAEYEALIKSLQAEAKAKAALPAAKPDPKPASSGATEEKIALAVIPLKNGKAEEVVKVLEKLLGGSKATFEVSNNSLIVAGPAGVVKDVKKIVADLDVQRGPKN